MDGKHMRYRGHEDWMLNQGRVGGRLVPLTCSLRDLCAFQAVGTCAGFVTRFLPMERLAVVVTDDGSRILLMSQAWSQAHPSDGYNFRSSFQAEGIGLPGKRGDPSHCSLSHSLFFFFGNSR